jgi:hypothetical protein
MIKNFARATGWRSTGLTMTFEFISNDYSQKGTHVSDKYIRIKNQELRVNKLQEGPLAVPSGPSLTHGSWEGTRCGATL